MIKLFLKRLLIFIIPVLLLLLPSFLILKGSNENFTSIDGVLKSNKKYLIGYAFNENNYGYIKWKNIEQGYKKDVWALGSSRVLQFRENMFDATFYNAGYTITSIKDCLPFLKAIHPDKYPKLLILGLDQWLFNYNYDDLETNRGTEFWEHSFTFFPSAATARTTFVSFLKGRYSLSLITNHDKLKIGLNAIVNNKGIRKDGSMSYGNQIDKLLKNDPSNNDYNYSNTLLRIKQGNSKFQYADHSNLNAYVELDSLLDFCSQNGIFVIGFLPPYASQVYQEMLKTNKYKYIKEIYPLASRYFSKYHFEFYDLTDIHKFGSDDHETLDGFHGGESTYLKMILYMIANKSKLSEFTNPSKLKEDLSNRVNSYAVYNY